MSDIPKYYLLKTRLRESIIRGEYPIGSMLPAEWELVKLFNVSRGTVRQALQVLQDEGIIARRSGSGTYVIRVPDKDAGILSFSEQVRRSGRSLTTKVLSAERLLIDEIPEIGSSSLEGGENHREWLKRAFLIIDNRESSETSIYRIERLRIVDGRPASWQELFLLADDFREDLLDVEDFSQSAFDIYWRYGRSVDWAEETLQAGRPNAEAQEKLEMKDIPPYDRLIYIRKRISYDADNLPVEAVISRDRHDCFSGYRYRLLEAKEEYDVAIPQKPFKTRSLGILAAP